MECFHTVVVILLKLTVLFVPSGLLRDELRGSSSEHGGLLLHSDARHQEPPCLRPVLQPQRTQDRQLPQPGGAPHSLLLAAVSFCMSLSACLHPLSLLPLSEGPGSSSGPQYVSCGHGCGSPELGAEGGGGEPGVPRLLGRPLPGNKT